jgi:hypothetical protein
MFVAGGNAGGLPEACFFASENVPKQGRLIPCADILSGDQRIGGKNCEERAVKRVEPS